MRECVSLPIFTDAVASMDILKVLASELARLREITGTDASQKLLEISPFELKSMLLSLLSGRLLEDLSEEGEIGAKEQRTGMGSIRKQIEERRVLNFAFFILQDAVLPRLKTLGLQRFSEEIATNLQF